MKVRSLFLLILATVLHAQQPGTPDAPVPAPSPTQPAPAKPHPVPPEIGVYYASAFAGPIAGIGDAVRRGELVGVSLGGVVAHRSLRAFTFPGFDMELAAIRPIQPGSTLDGIFSFNLQPAYAFKSNRAAPYLTAGYSRVFLSGNAINFGTGINLFPKSTEDQGHFFRVEARDYYTFAAERQHLVTLRLAFCFGLPDD